MRKSKKIEVSAEDLDVLQKRSKSRTESKQAVERARIILLCFEGKSVKEVAAIMDTYPNKVIEWRERYRKEGLEGLEDRPRTGKPKSYIGLREKVLNRLNAPVPDGHTRWSAQLLAKELDCSPYAVWRVLKDEEIFLLRRRSWYIPAKSGFIPKTIDIIGLYLNPPLKALVICVDKKPGAKEKTGYVQTNDAKTQQAYRSIYKQTGKLSLLTALNVAIRYENEMPSPQKIWEDFKKYMSDVDKECLKEQEIHVILDNIHKENEDRLPESPNVHFHFTPATTSWIHQVETWLHVLSRKRSATPDFTPPRDLRERIETYLANCNNNCKPFRWRKMEEIYSF